MGPFDANKGVAEGGLVHVEKPKFRFQKFPRLKEYRGEIYSLQILLSRTQAGPGRAVKEQQEQNSPNHVQRINLISVQCTD